jgi:hypothetical protein
VARAYVDQLVRSKTLGSDRASSVRGALDRLDRLQTGREANAGAVLSEVQSLAGGFARDAGAARGQDQARLRALADTLERRVARLRQ